MFDMWMMALRNSEHIRCALQSPNAPFTLLLRTYTDPSVGPWNYYALAETGGDDVVIE
jgi:hypothetical protein